jgi:hypothetical protein
MEKSTTSTGKRVHGPANADSYDEEEQKRPKYILHAVSGLAAAEETESHGNGRGKQEKGLHVREMERIGEH